jgi:hypothetical protein
MIDAENEDEFCKLLLSLVFSQNFVKHGSDSEVSTAEEYQGPRWACFSCLS